MRPVRLVGRHGPHLDARLLKSGVGVAQRGQLAGAVAGEAAWEERDEERLLAAQLAQVVRLAASVTHRKSICSNSCCSRRRLGGSGTCHCKRQGKDEKGLQHE